MLIGLHGLAMLENHSGHRLCLWGLDTSGDVWTADVQRRGRIAPVECELFPSATDVSISIDNQGTLVEPRAAEVTAVFGGRWQPFHNGQLHVLRAVANDYPDIVVGIVNPDPAHPPDSEFERFQRRANPLTYWERTAMLTCLLRDEKLDNRVALVPLWHPRADMTRDSYYLPPKRRRVWIVPTVDESEESKVSDFRRQGETVVSWREFDRSLLGERSTILRARVLEGEDISDSVPPAISAALTPTTAAHGRWTNASNATRPIFAGRWQPLHNGHLWVIREVLARHDELVLGIITTDLVRSPLRKYQSFHEVHNPFTFWERMQMVRAVLAAENLLDRVYVVPLGHPRADLGESDAFLPPKRRWILPQTSRHEEEKAADLSKLGEDVEPLVVPPEIAAFSSSAVKALVHAGHDWRQDVPDPVAALAAGFLIEERVRTALTRYREVFDIYISDEKHRRPTT